MRQVAVFLSGVVVLTSGQDPSAASRKMRGSSPACAGRVGMTKEGRHPAAKFLASIVFYHPICCGSAMSIILSLHPNMFLNARGTFAVKNRCSAASISSRAN